MAHLNPWRPVGYYKNRPMSKATTDGWIGYYERCNFIVSEAL